MAGREDPGEPLPAPPFDVLEAFLDGEGVDPFTLKRALEEPAGREHLVDLLLLREAVNGLDRTAWTMPPRGSAVSRSRWWAAAAIVVSLAAGFAAGQRTLAATARESGVEAVIEVPRPSIAPAPTRTIALEPGVNWTDSPGGK